MNKGKRGVTMVKKVIFNSPEDDDRGGSLLMRTGSVIFTDKELEYIVPEESIEVLKKEGDFSFTVEQIEKEKS